MGTAGHSWAQRHYPLEGVACVDCGVAARERHHVDGNSFNNAPENVAFLCTSCHRKRDGRVGGLPQVWEQDRARAHCARGHEYTPANTYWFLQRGYALRRCRACNSQKQREYRARKA